MVMTVVFASMGTGIGLNTDVTKGIFDRFRSMPISRSAPQSLQGFGFIVMFPLTFGSNVFIQAGTLPGWLQAWVRVNPVTALAEASRGLALGRPVTCPAWHSIAWSIATTSGSTTTRQTKNTWTRTCEKAE